MLGLRLVCAEGSLGLLSFFLYASLTGPALTLLKDCLGSLLGPLFSIPPASDPVLLYVSTTEALAAWSLVDLHLVCAWSALGLRLMCG